MTELASGYDPKSFESRLYAEWESAGYFKPRGTGTPYTILLPPPNVTGTLHMGHAFQHTLQDALIRYHRMRGFDALWQMGSDHAGIATQNGGVEQSGPQEGNGVSSSIAMTLGRDEASWRRVWEWKATSTATSSIDQLQEALAHPATGAAQRVHF